MIEDPSSANPTVLAQYIYDLIDAWRKQNFRDWELWELYTSCFSGWTEAIFIRVDSTTKSTLRKYLIENGVYMVRVHAKGRGNLAEQLMQPLLLETYHDWTPEEFESWANPKAGMRFNINSSFNPRDPNYRGPKPEQREVIGEKEKIKMEENKDREIEDENKNIENLKQDKIFKEINPDGESLSPLLGNYRPWEDRPQPKNRQLESLIKLYKETDKYRDGTDSFDYKLMIFLDNCHNACVEPRNYASALTNMFILPARDVYLDGTLSKPDMTFEERCKLMKNHYETEPWRISRENIWNGMDLPRLLRQHPERTFSETFEWLNAETRRVQRGLPNHQGDFALRQRIISACYGCPELRPVLLEPPSDAEGVCNKIRAQIAQLEFTSSTGNFIPTIPIHNSIHMADRHFNTVGNYSKSRKFLNRGATGNSGKTMEKDNTPAKWAKRCLVCQKSNC